MEGEEKNKAGSGKVGLPIEAHFHPSAHFQPPTTASDLYLQVSDLCLHIHPHIQPLIIPSKLDVRLTIFKLKFDGAEIEISAVSKGEPGVPNNSNSFSLGRRSIKSEAKRRAVTDEPLPLGFSRKADINRCTHLGNFEKPSLQNVQESIRHRRDDVVAGGAAVPSGVRDGGGEAEEFETMEEKTGNWRLWVGAMN
ncbi:glycine--tRNA ligase [Striga asiatica]|uniref:Glycine--tRNA ligase n=1 Tax=Striga asiatica TaxID=4170 RepID=A0A5A7P179_STRAF|nr:glycine--tRNA ligase [Striga asiatica]